MTTMIAAVLAESTTENATPVPILMGVVAFGTLIAALIIVTRFNKDR